MPKRMRASTTQSKSISQGSRFQSSCKAKTPFRKKGRSNTYKVSLKRFASGDLPKMLKDRLQAELLVYGTVCYHTSILPNAIEIHIVNPMELHTTQQ